MGSGTRMVYERVQVGSSDGSCLCKLDLYHTITTITDGSRGSLG